MIRSTDPEPTFARPVLVVKHVPWEGPHRIAEALLAAGLTIDERCPIEGDPLPAVDEVSGAVFMGGPMNVDEVEHYPALADEREWLAEAIAAELPVLGVCLGSQLIARALGAQVRPGPAPEIGWLEVRVDGESDPIVRSLAPTSTVLHWHGDVFDLPAGATRLAASAMTETQAFRHTNAWAVLFHTEADAALIDLWLAEPTMAREAESVLGPDYAERLAIGAADGVDRLVPDSNVMFEGFAALITESNRD